MEIVAHSDTGRIRRNNEDSVAYDPDAAVAVLADGMGGLDAGEIASSVAVDVVLAELRFAEEHSEGLLKAAVETANSAVRYAAAQASVDMGTTLVAWLLTRQGQCFVANVGDSRVYRIRGGALRRLTSDHSMVQQMIDDGVLSEAEAQTSPQRNVITRALGLEERVEVDVRSWVYAPGDLYLLCSDGLTDMITEAEITAILGSQLSDADGSLEAAAAGLVSGANEAGGHDNVSVLLIRPG